ncbi:hypothetical protein NIES4106_62020 (plasmid) [Fischerella sp. NIES-4106]|nr:hypothetical protein NIES4106_62020 [Fischerella sp. NIES-4106]
MKKTDKKREELTLEELEDLEEEEFWSHPDREKEQVKAKKLFGKKNG